MRDLPVGHFYGESKLRLASQGLTVSQVRHPDPKRLPMHGHQNAFLTIVLNGFYTERFAGKVVEFSPNSMCIHQASIEHQDQIENGGSTLLCAEMSPAWIERRLGIHAFSTDVHGMMETTHFTRRLCSVLGIAGLEILAEELIVEIVGSRCLKGNGRGTPTVFQKARDLVHDCFSDNLTVQDVAHELGTHAVYVSRVFRQKTGYTLGEYLHRVRVETAARRALESEEPLADIALACGFFDQSHFTRVFKTFTGYTPGQWRKIAAGNRHPG